MPTVPRLQRFVGNQGVQRLFRAQTSRASAGRVPPIVQDVLRSPGEPLDEPTRAFMEPRFGLDFGAVRVHVGEQAARSARTVNARAYAVGNDLVFAAGAYAPGTGEGRRLLAHELAHVGQQQGDGCPALKRYEVQDCDPAENPLQIPQTVHDAHQAALGMLTTAIQKSATPTDPAVQAAAIRYFKIPLPAIGPRDAALWNHVTRALATMRHADTDAIYECEPRQSWWHGGCIAGNVAVSLWNIHLCPLWWTRYRTMDARAAILLHEWGHKWGKGVNRIFETYCWEPKYAGLPAERRVTLPDAYMGYVYELATGTPRCI